MVVVVIVVVVFEGRICLLSFSAFSSNIYSIGLLLALTEMYAGSMVSSAVNSQGKFHRVHSAWEWHYTSARVIQCFWLGVRKGVWLLKICASHTQKLSLGSSGGRTGGDIVRYEMLF